MVPIVLHHGIFNFFTFSLGRLKVSSFGGNIEEAIALRGHPVIVSKVHPTAGIATRAAELKESILTHLDRLGRPNDSVVIIAHSMGGLDARYMISRLDIEHRVRALVTISTPHRGSPYADWCRQHVSRLGGLSLATWLGLDIEALDDLTIESCRRFNANVPDSPSVRYFSISGARPWYQVPPFAVQSWHVIHEAEGANDGLVSVQSSIWARHLGVWPVDHWHQVNKRMAIGRGIGNITPLYLRMLDQIQNEGVSMSRDHAQRIIT